MLRFTLRIYDTIFRAFRVCILMELEVYLPTLLLLLLLRSLWMNILLVLFWWLPVGTGCGSAVDGLAPVSQTHNESAASPTLHSASLLCHAKPVQCIIEWTQRLTGTRQTRQPTWQLTWPWAAPSTVAKRHYITLFGIQQARGGEQSRQPIGKSLIALQLNKSSIIYALAMSWWWD